jgi:hypothetical protein
MALFYLILFNFKILFLNQIPGNKIYFIYEAGFTDKHVVIDGKLDEPLWKNAEDIVLLDNENGNPVSDARLKTVVETGYDRKNLYVAFVCNDRDIWSSYRSRDQHLWTDEAVEVFIDTDTESANYVELEISPHNVIFDSYITDTLDIDFKKTSQFNIQGIKSAVKVYGTIDQNNDIDSSWVIEIAIPIHSITGSNNCIKPGVTEWKINYYRINRDFNSKSICYSWSPTFGSNHRPSKFGILKFGKIDK